MTGSCPCYLCRWEAEHQQLCSGAISVLIADEPSKSIHNDLELVSWKLGSAGNSSSDPDSLSSDSWGAQQLQQWPGASLCSDSWGAQQQQQWPGDIFVPIAEEPSNSSSDPEIASVLIAEELSNCSNDPELVSVLIAEEPSNISNDPEISLFR